MSTDGIPPQGPMNPQPYPGQPYPGQPMPQGPYMYPPQQPAPKPKSKLPAVIGGVVGACVLVCALCGVLVLANGNKDANSGTVVGNTNTGTPSSTSSASKHFQPGQQVKVGNAFILTVNSAKTVSGDEFSQPKSGDTFLVVDVTIKNVSSSEQTVSSLLSFNLKDSTGQKYNETILSSATPPDGKIEAGDVLRGQIAYEVPASQHAFTFSFDADLVTSGQTIWDLKI